MTAPAMAHRRRRAPVALLLALALAAGMAPAFLPAAPAPASHRRAVLSGAVAGALLTEASANAVFQMDPPKEPAVKLKAPPKQIEVQGLPGSRNKGNGFWTIVPEQKVNDRAVYKRDGQDIYLLFGDCGSFQLIDRVTGECSGWAIETKGKWAVDGVETRALRLAPVKEKPPIGSTEALEAAQEERKTEAPSSFNIKALLGLQDKVLDEKEQDALIQKSLESGDSVLEYIRANGGLEFIANVMKLTDEEVRLSDSLEARLASKEVSLKKGK